MTFSKSDLEKIKAKILLSSEIEKKTRLTKKGNDYWCCCLFHEEKTPSFKINDDLGSFYCFGCGVKGDIFTLYTEFYNYSFQDAVSELGQRAGITLHQVNNKQTQKINTIKKILEATTNWYVNNLEFSEALVCKKYLKKRNLSESTIKKFRIGYSYNSNSTLFSYLKSKSFNEKDIIKSNVVKFDNNNKIKDYFYKRLIFPIMDENSNVKGFGGRSLDNAMPKYINSPESDFFQKRYLLYNLSNAKISARKKNNLLICEGYMDVISLYEKKIESVVSPLGTALTEQQLNLAWKYSSKPTLMFDGDTAGLRAAYKSALLSLKHLSANRLLQFITLPQNEDPDSFVNNKPMNDFIKILKKPLPLVNFVFYHASLANPLNNIDDKIIFDKYLNDIIETINDKKIKYFYKNEFQSLFFDRIKSRSKKIYSKRINFNSTKNSLFYKQLCSFIATYINHKSIRVKILKELLNADILDESTLNLLKEISQPTNLGKSAKELLKCIKDKKIKKTFENCLKVQIYQLFPYSSPKFDSNQALQETKESCDNLKTRLLNLKKINKRLNSFLEDSNQLNWEELQKINNELIEN